MFKKKQYTVSRGNPTVLVETFELLKINMGLPVVWEISES
jgi:hypothetical protein